ncbi:unnamed protein product [Anisakis simplex]|uniref:Uncharacterized protein n=1 Tax=Anisakis simplex TaxID=6269 RepID=A0A0M3JYP7_ANISI|nr:unnamed protein product [Anisakis simplex]
MEVDGFAEANQLLCSALEQLDDIIASENERLANEVDDNDVISMNRPRRNRRRRNEKNMESISSSSGGSSNSSSINGESQSPPSDIPESSSISNTTPNIFEAFLRAIDKNEIVERPGLETQLKIMHWLCGTDGSQMKASLVFIVANEWMLNAGNDYRAC